MHVILLQTRADYMYNYHIFPIDGKFAVYYHTCVKMCKGLAYYTVTQECTIMPTIEVTKTVCVAIAEYVLLGKYCFTKHCFCVLIARLH